MLERQDVDDVGAQSRWARAQQGGAAPNRPGLSECGVDAVAQRRVGRRVRELLVARGYPSVAAEGFQAPSVVVSYTTDPELQSGKKPLAAGLQIASGVPLQCDEGADFRSFRIGLFGLDKLHHPERTLENLRTGLDVAGC